MTTSHSPRHVLKAQADMIAAKLKAMERGEKVAGDPADKIATARTGESITFAVAMDDKTLKITMAWAGIKAASEAKIADYILTQMLEKREA